MIRFKSNCRSKSADYYSKSRLEYDLRKMDRALVLQVTYQSPDITAFLRNNNYQASNGIVIATSAFPEFQESGKQGKVILYLQGDDPIRNYKLDVTRFVSNMQRDAKYNMVNEALTEFVGYIKSLNRYQPYSINDDLVFVCKPY